jgi:hypothetical protein
MQKPDIRYLEEISGYCPVQAEGTVNGYPFYFRSRHQHWALYIGPKGSTANMHDREWSFREVYPGCADETPTDYGGRLVYFSAGSAGKKECAEFIERAAVAFLDDLENGEVFNDKN